MVPRIETRCSSPKVLATPYVCSRDITILQIRLVYATGPTVLEKNLNSYDKYYRFCKTYNGSVLALRPLELFILHTDAMATHNTQSLPNRLQLNWLPRFYPKFIAYLRYCAMSTCYYRLSFEPSTNCACYSLSRKIYDMLSCLYTTTKLLM
jgi:hypothetical protein